MEIPSIHIDSGMSSPSMGSSPEPFAWFGPKRRNSKPAPVYKNILIKNDDKEKSKDWKKVVSFDSIPLVLNSEDIHNFDYTSDCEDDDIGSPKFDESFSRGRSRSPYRSTSPHRSPSPYGSNLSSNVLDGILHGNGYPTVPMINIDSYLNTKQHTNFNKFIKENGKRSIVVYITGRRHSWVSLDFVIKKVLKDGDELIIVSRIPEDYKDLTIPHDDSYYKHKFHYSSKGIKNRHAETNQKIMDKQVFFKKIINELIKYVEYLVPDKLIIKITIDFYLSSSAFKVIDQCIDIYQPSLICISSKPNLRFSRTTTWKTSRISDRLINKFDIPILITPSLTMNEFEIKVFNLEREEVNLDKLYSVNPSFTSLTQKRELSPLRSTRSTRSARSSVISSDTESDSDVSSTTSSVRELTKTFTTYRNSLQEFFNKEEDVHLDLYHDRMNEIIKITKKMDKTFQNYSKNDYGDGAELVRSMTQLPKVAKTKSMLDDIDDDFAKNKKKVDKLKKQLNTTTTSTQSERRLTSPPGSRSIKFLDLNKPNLLKQSSANSGLSRFRTNVEDNYLKPVNSGEINKLSKSISLYNNSEVFSSTDSLDKKKKRRSSIFKFFKR